MKVLLSAYACEPNKGSEPGVGWHWCLEIAHLGHEVWVITRANNQYNIEQELEKLPPLPNLHFVYYDLPKWAGWWKRGPRIGLVNLYYALWQFGAYLKARQLLKQFKFDIVHHLTFGVFRQASFMEYLGVPFIFGPVGGGERVPICLRKNYSLRGHVLDFFRDILNLVSRFDPILLIMYGQAKRIYVKTPQTGAMIPSVYQQKVQTLVEIGIAPDSISQKTFLNKEFSSENPMKVLYVGKFLYWKGMQLALPAYAKLLTEVPHAQLTLVGKGPEKRLWEKYARKYKVYSKITWVDWVTQQDLKNIYKEHDVFLFPSLHDSSGNVLLEAMSHSLPVVCLDLGGPGVIVNEQCGIVVNTKNCDAEEVTRKLYEALKKLAEMPADNFNKLCSGAYQRAMHFSWSLPVKTIYEQDLKQLL